MTKSPTLSFLVPIASLRYQTASDLVLAVLDFLDRAIGNQPSLIQDGDAIGHTPGATHVVGDDDQRRPTLNLFPQQQLVDLGRGDAIEPAARLVDEQDCGSSTSARASPARFRIPPESCDGIL